MGAFYANEVLTRGAATRNGRDTEAFLSLYRVAASPLALRGVLGNVPLLRPGSPVYNAALPAVTPDSGINDRYRQESDSLALFTHNVINVTDAFSITLGLRYTNETKDYAATYRTIPSAGCAYLESVYGLNPNGNSTLNPGGGAAPAASALCLPWTRTALDVLTASAPHLQSKTENEWSGIATLSYEFSDAFNAYFTYSRGYKAGGFNLDRAYSVDNGTFAGSSIVRCADGSDGSPAQLAGPTGSPVVLAAAPYTCARPGTGGVNGTVIAPDTSFAPELVDAFELGAKGSFFDGDLNVNVALFYQKFTDFQLNTFTGISFVVTSVPEVIAKGVELDANWRATDGLTFNFGAAYNESRYGDDLGSLTQRGSFLFENPNLLFLPGAQLTSAPRWTLTGSMTYEFPIMAGAYLGSFHVDGRWVSDQVTGSNLDPAKTQEAFALFNFRFSACRPRTKASRSSSGPGTCSTSATIRSRSTRRSRAMLRRPWAWARTPPRSRRSARSWASPARWARRFASATDASRMASGGPGRPGRFVSGAAFDGRLESRQHRGGLGFPCVRYVLLLILAGVAGLAAYLATAAVPFEPVAWTPPANPGQTGPFAAKRAIEGRNARRGRPRA